jgi:hypothetical protein
MGSLIAFGAVLGVMMGHMPLIEDVKEVNAPPARGERYPDRLKAGDVAADFTLPFATGQGSATLSSFRGSKPVVLIFGSYT